MSAPGPASTDAVNNVSPIPTPWPVRWRRFRYRAVPFITMAICLLITIWLWRRHAGSGNAVGAVETYRADVSSDAVGVLVPLEGREIRLFDHVAKHQVVARLDDKALRAEHDRKQRELKALAAQMEAAQSSGAAATAPSTRPAMSLESMELSAVAKAQEIEALEHRIAACAIRAPFAGVVTELHRRPGESVHVGRQIMEIAAEGGTHVISYLRQESAIQPVAGMKVQVRRTLGNREVQVGTVEAVGAQYQAVPAHQLIDKKTPEWGLPVRIRMPDGTILKPGELVNITFPHGVPTAAHVAGS